MTSDVPTNPLKTFLEFVSVEAESDAEAVRIPEDIARRENDAFLLEQRSAELFPVLEPVRDRQKAVDACRLEPVEIVAFGEFGDAVAVAFAWVRFASRISDSCSSSACCAMC